MTDPVHEVPELHDPPVVALCDVRDEPLGVDEVLQAVRHPRCGGIALFVGVVREHDHGADVSDRKSVV